MVVLWSDEVNDVNNIKHMSTYCTPVTCWGISCVIYAIEKIHKNGLLFPACTLRTPNIAPNDFVNRPTAITRIPHIEKLYTNTPGISSLIPALAFNIFRNNASADKIKAFSKLGSPVICVSSSLINHCNTPQGWVKIRILTSGTFVLKDNIASGFTALGRWHLIFQKAIHHDVLDLPVSSMQQP